MVENIRTLCEGASVILSDSTNWSSASRNGGISEYEQTVNSALVLGIKYELSDSSHCRGGQFEEEGK
jgi:hypothetical protein